MKAQVILGLVALLALAGCDDPASYQANAPVMPKVSGCDIQRYEVRTCKGCGTEVVYLARCKPTETVSTSMTRSCGKSCTQRITTITTTEGVPEEKQ